MTKEFEDNMAELREPRDFSQPMVYIFLRKDLDKINPMYSAIQLGHVCYQLGLANKNSAATSNTAFCVFEVNSENQLLFVADNLVECNYAFEMFREPDYDTGYTAIACHPVTGYRRSYFAQFKLYKSASIWTRIGWFFQGLFR